MQPASPGSRLAICGIASHTRGRHCPSEPRISSAPQTIPSQNVFAPSWSSPSTLLVPAGQDRQSPHATYSFTAQVAAAHTWLTHTALKQSLSTEHVSPESHPEQTSPPQSTSVSAPFCAPSSQAIRSLHTPSPQNPEAQSLLCTQARPSAHAAQSIPPQSISVSTPFCSPSPHTPAANWQLSTPPRHTHAPSGVQIGGLWLK